MGVRRVAAVDFTASAMAWVRPWTVMVGGGGARLLGVCVEVFVEVFVEVCVDPVEPVADAPPPVEADTLGTPPPWGEVDVAEAPPPVEADAV